MRQSIVGMLALSLVACGPKKPTLPLPVPGLADPGAVVSDFRAAPELGALRIRARLRVRSPERSVSTPASVVLSGPDRLRIDVFTPLGTPFAILATDGTGLHVWLQRESTFLRGDDAVSVLQKTTGDVLGPADLLAMLTGRLPVVGARVEAAQPTALGGVEVVLAKDAVPAYRLRALLDPTARLVRSLSVHETPDTGPTALGPPRLVVTYPGAQETEDGTWRPDAVVVELPELGWTVTLDISDWEILPAAPDVFSLTPPPGAREQDLVTVLERLTAPQAKAGQPD